MIDLRNYGGVWAILPAAARIMESRARRLASIDSGVLKFALEQARASAEPGSDERFVDSLLVRRGRVTEIHVRGILSKEPLPSREIFADPPTYSEIGAAMRLAATDGSEHALCIVDSPGGSIAGLSSAVDAARELAAAKPLTLFVDDCVASAAYELFGLTGAEIVAHERAEVGGIGIFAVLHDVSQVLESAGIKVHVVSTGGLKGAGVDGSITPELLQYVQEQVNVLGSMFAQALASGRGMKLSAAEKLMDGRTHFAARALELGLIDRVESLAALRRRLGAEEDTMTDTAPAPPAPPQDPQPAQRGAIATAFAALGRALGLGSETSPTPPTQANDRLAAMAEELASLRTSIQQRDDAHAAALAAAAVDADLERLSEQIAPAARAKLRPVLLALKTAGKGEDYTAVLEAATPFAASGLQVLGAEFAGAGESGTAIAGDTTSPDVIATSARHGITPARRAELLAKYGTPRRVN